LRLGNAMLQHQLMVLRRRVRGRVRLTNNDRWFFIHATLDRPLVRSRNDRLRVKRTCRASRDTFVFGPRTDRSALFDYLIRGG
jgi:hypothetical protein